MDEKWIVCTQAKDETHPGFFSTHSSLEKAKLAALRLSKGLYAVIEIKHWKLTVHSGWVYIPQNSLFVLNDGFESGPQKITRERIEFLNMSDRAFSKKIHDEEKKERARKRREKIGQRESAESISKSIVACC